MFCRIPPLVSYSFALSPGIIIYSFEKFILPIYQNTVRNLCRSELYFILCSEFTFETLSLKKLCSKVDRFTFYDDSAFSGCPTKNELGIPHNLPVPPPSSSDEMNVEQKNHSSSLLSFL